MPARGGAQGVLGGGGGAVGVVKRKLNADWVECLTSLVETTEDFGSTRGQRHRAGDGGLRRGEVRSLAQRDGSQHFLATFADCASFIHPLVLAGGVIYAQLRLRAVDNNDGVAQQHVKSAVVSVEVHLAGEIDLPGSRRADR